MPVRSDLGFAHLTNEGVSVNAWHADIGQQHIELGNFQMSPRFRDRRCRLHNCTGRSENDGDQLSRVGVVIDDERATRLQQRCIRGLRSSSGGLRGTLAMATGRGFAGSSTKNGGWDEQDDDTDRRRHSEPLHVTRCASSRSREVSNTRHLAPPLGITELSCDAPTHELSPVRARATGIARCFVA